MAQAKKPENKTELINSNLKMFYTNVNGLFNKIDELKLVLEMHPEIAVICLTETHLSKDILDAEIHIDGFIMFRKDRDFKLDYSKHEISKGGGSIVYVKSCLDVSTCNLLEDTPDSLAVYIRTRNVEICVACIYRSSSLNSLQNKKLLSSLEKICHADNLYETVLIGDFNLPKVSWDRGQVIATSNSKDQCLILQQMFIDLFNDKGLSWYFTDEITRQRLVKDTLQQSLLDQVLCTNDALVNRCEIVSPLGKSDHKGIHVELAVSVSEDPQPKEKYLKPSWGKISGKELIDFSKDNINWEYQCQENVKDMWHELYDKLKSVSDTVPCTAVYQDSRPVKLPWSSSKLMRMRRNKDKAWSAFDEKPDIGNLNYALEKQNLFEKEEIKSKLNYEKKITSNLKVNCKSMFAYLRNKRQVKSCIPSLDKGDGTQTRNSVEAAEVLADAFSSVFVAEPFGPLPEMMRGNENCIPDLEIESEDVKRELLKLNIYKSCGPDGVHPKLLKSLAYDSSFVDAVTKLFKECLSSGDIPEIWKTASVVGLFKKGSKADPLNYRPVSLTCILCKVFEQLLRRHIVCFLESDISIHQHGFVEGKSCLSNLLETFDDIIELLERGAPVDLLYFDFSKAFDTVPHYRLLSKLENFGIRGRILDVIRKFLSDRTIRVQVEGKYSFIRNVLSGVPQGSVLGPLLFLLFINDLPDSVKNKVKLFADDLKLIGNAAHSSSIIEDLKQLEEWENLWLLRFNPSKCKVIHLEFNDNPNIDYYLDGVNLNPSELEKDLGVSTHRSLLWNVHIKECISKANKMICWIARNLMIREKYVMLNIYKSLIRPHLEYCVQMWNPVAAHGSWKTILELEAVQRRYTRMIDDIGVLPYSERLDALKLTTLAERRIRGDLIETFKVFSNLVDYGSNIFKASRSGSNIVSRINLAIDNSNVKNIRKTFLSERVLPFWNALPISVKNSSSVNDFKINLEVFKNDCIKKGITQNCHHWSVSDEVLCKIEGGNYLENKKKFNEYVWFHPELAKKSFINLHSC